MTVRLFYVDESFDDTKFCLSAIGVTHVEWHECFRRVREHRTQLKRDHGLYLRKEVHAHEFVSGRGQVSDRVVGKYTRTRIFEGLLKLTAELPSAMVMNVCLDRRGRKDVQLDAWDRLVNRIERTMLEMESRELPLRRSLVASASTGLTAIEGHDLELRLTRYRPRAIIIADEGRELELTRVLRKMSVYNPVPSRLGAWADGTRARNIPVERVIEDPVFKKSHQSYFIQLADAVAFALLKREVPPTPHVKKYGLDRMFERCLAQVCVKRASPADPLGIVRK